MTSNFALGIDIGGSGIKGALVDLTAGDFATERLRIDTPSESTPANVAAIVGEIVENFAEHLGRCIYGGLYEPGSPLADEKGYRKDVMEAIKDLGVTEIRKLAKKQHVLYDIKHVFKRTEVDGRL